MSSLPKQPILLTVLFCAGVLAGCSHTPNPSGQCSETESSTPGAAPGVATGEIDRPAGTAADLEPGMRLVTIPIATENQPPNLQPGDIVDLYANVMRRSGTQGYLVLERVEIRLVNSRIVEGGRTQSSADGNVTIELDRTEVAHIADLQSRIAGNKFFIVLRNPNDTDTELDAPGRVNPELLDLLGLPH